MSKNRQTPAEGDSFRIKLTEDERRALRVAFLTGPVDVPMQIEEAAVFLGCSPHSLQMSNAPRARFGGRVLFLRSQLLRYLEHNHTVLLSDVPPNHPARISA